MTTDNRDAVSTNRDAEAEAKAGGAGEGQAGGAGGETEVDWQERATELETRLKQEREKALAEKQSLEDARRRLQEMEAAQTAPPTSSDPRAYLQNAVMTVRAAATGQYVDPQELAAAQLAVWQYQEQENAHRWRESEIARLPDDEQAEVRKYLNSGEYGSVAAARKAVKADRLEAQQGQWDKDKREREAAEARRREAAESGVRDTSVRALSATEVKSRTMPLSEYTAKLNSLPMQERIALKRRADSGEILLDYNA